MRFANIYFSIIRNFKKYETVRLAISCSVTAEKEGRYEKSIIISCLVVKFYPGNIMFSEIASQRYIKIKFLECAPVT